MRKLQTDKQWAAVVILPSELIIFYFGSIFFESISLHASKKNLEVPAACILQTSRRTMMGLGVFLRCFLNRLHSIMGIDPRYLHTSLFSNLKKD